MFFGVYFLSCYCLVFLSAQDLHITCPASGFTEGVSASVTCKANKSAFITACMVPPSLVRFYFTNRSGIRDEWCASSFTTCPNTGIRISCESCSCGCETDDGTFSTHRLDFPPTFAQDGGNFICHVICGHTLPLPSLTKDSCDAVSVGELIFLAIINDHVTCLESVNCVAGCLSLPV